MSYDDEYNRATMTLSIACCLYTNLTPFRSVPILLIDTSMIAPGTRYFGGFNPAPTPPGVPVIMTDPLRNVVPWDKKCTR